MRRRKNTGTKGGGTAGRAATTYRLDQADLTSIFFCCFCAPGVFGRVIVSTSFEKSAATFVAINACPQLERALERGIGALRKAVVLVLLLLTLLAFEDEHVAGHRYVGILGIETGQLCRVLIGFVVFAHVDRRYRKAECAHRTPGLDVEHAAQRRKAEPIEQSVHFVAKGSPHIGSRRLRRRCLLNLHWYVCHRRLHRLRERKRVNLTESASLARGSIETLTYRNSSIRRVPPPRPHRSARPRRGQRRLGGAQHFTGAPYSP